MTARRAAHLLLVLVFAPLWASAQSATGTPRSTTPTRRGSTRLRPRRASAPSLLKDAIDFAVASETKAPRDLKLNHYQTFGREPFGYAIGPIKDRGDPTGIIVHKGYVVAEWGDPLRVDMAHSVTKSFLSSVIGIAVDRGMIKSINDTVREYVPPIQALQRGSSRQQIRQPRHA